MKLEKSYNDAGIPVLKETYEFNGEECYRNYIDGQRLSIENVSTMYLTTYDNKDNDDMSNWITKLAVVAPESKGKPQNHYLNYWPCSKGFKLSKKRADAHAEKRGYSKAEIERWYSVVECKMREILMAHRVQGTRTNTTKNPVYYTAPVRYSIGTKAFMSFAVAMLIEDSKGDILKEVIMIGDITHEHSPRRETSHVRHSKDKNVPSFKKSNQNGYSFTKVRLWNDDAIEDDWLDNEGSHNEALESELDYLLEVV
ncbi:hypothetical protein [Vibrio campbellii]|uniref:hypothetical protein n=1 Tax=Vibrio campbellii TaxID=680 RepID=UPI003F8794AB